MGYTFEIYFDFHGYSLIAIGICNMIGIKIPKNFNLPYHAISFRDFWRRWHISLSTWFRDYIYIPLKSDKRIYSIQNFSVILLVFSLSGIWHGNTVLFLIWGLLHGLIYLIEWICGLDSITIDEKGKTSHFIKTVITFCLIVLTWLPFRSESVSFLLSAYDKIFRFSFNYFDSNLTINHRLLLITVLLGYFSAPFIYRKFSLKTKPALIILIAIATVLFRYGESSFIYYRF